MAANNNSIQDSIKGGSTYLIQQTLSNIKNAKLIIADMRAALANNHLLDEGRLSPLQEIKNKIDNYIVILSSLKGEKKSFADQIQEKNKNYDEQLLKLEKKYQKLEEDYNKFKKIKEDLEKKYIEENKHDPAILELLKSLATLSVSYERNVRQFVAVDVKQLKNNLEILKNDAKNHTPLEHQRKIEAPAVSTPTLH